MRRIVSNHFFHQKLLVFIFIFPSFFESIFLAFHSRHERDSRRSQSRSGKISKLLRRHFSGFWEKVPFSLVKAAGKLRLGTTLNRTPAVHFFTFQRSGRGTEQTQKMPGKERQCSVQVRSGKKFRSSPV
jgi:hypothetical protein